MHRLFNYREAVAYAPIRCTYSEFLESPTRFLENCSYSVELSHFRIEGTGSHSTFASDPIAFTILHLAPPASPNKCDNLQHSKHSTAYTSHSDKSTSSSGFHCRICKLKLRYQLAYSSSLHLITEPRTSNLSQQPRDKHDHKPFQRKVDSIVLWQCQSNYEGVKIVIYCQERDQQRRSHHFATGVAIAGARRAKTWTRVNIFRMMDILFGSFCLGKCFRVILSENFH